MNALILRRSFWLVSLLLLAVMSPAQAFPSSATGKTIHVPADYAKIQDAVDAASNGDTVLIADGTYSGPGNRDIDLQGKSTTVTSQNGPIKTIIDCGGYESTDGSGNHRGFYLHSGEKNVTISGFTVKNGYETSIRGIPNSDNGGGIYNSNPNGTITLTNCTITGNTARYYGGGVFNSNVNGTIALTNCTITGNAAGSEGGGVFNFNGNPNGTITLTNCTITGNTATYDGGGVFNRSFNSNSTITLTNCTVTGNTAAHGFGGGVYNNYYNHDFNPNSTITLTNCTVTGNTAADGGGVYNSNVSGTITLTSCTIAGNTATYDGGGVFNANAGNTVNGTITLTNCTITGNTATFDGGGVYYVGSGTSTLTNDIIYGDAGGEVFTYRDYYTPATISYCDVQGGSPGTGNINADPQFVNAATGDLHLKPGSPCLGAGTATGAPSTDLDGNPRPNPPSMGAYELGAGATVIHFTAENIIGDADGIVCDNLNGMDVSLKDTLTITLSDPKAIISDTSVTNPDGTVKDRHGHFNVGTFVSLLNKVVYFPPDEFNFEQQPQGTGQDDTGNDWITKATTRLVKLTMHYTSGGKSLTATKDIVLARPPVVLVHGINSNPTRWQPFINAIASSGFGEPFVTVNHSDPRAYQGVDFTAVPGGLFGGNAPVEIGADLLSQRLQTTLDQVHQGSPLSDADENTGTEINTTKPFLNPASASGQSYRLADRRFDVVAWSYGGVIARWYINSGVPTDPATGQPISQSWYGEQPKITWGDLDHGFHEIAFPVLPNAKYHNDVRKVITLGSMWRGVPLANYANEVLFPPTNAVALRDAPLNQAADVLSQIANLFHYDLGTNLGQLVNFLDTKIPVKPHHAHSMQVIAVNSPWLSELIYHSPKPGGVPNPFSAGIAYGSVAGDDNRYPLTNVSGVDIPFDTYTALDLSTSTLQYTGTSFVPYSWFPYLGIEHKGQPSVDNYSDGIVPVWSSAIPGSYTLAPSTHKDYASNLDTQNYVLQHLNSAALPLGSELNSVWNDPTSWNNPIDAVTVQSKTWQYIPEQMAPVPQNDLYQQIGSVGRINPTALREINTVTYSSLGASSVVIGWVTATATDSKVSLYILDLYGLSATLIKEVSVTEKTKNHQVLITGLSANTKYYYRVESTYDNSPDAAITLSSPASGLPSFRTTTDVQPDIFVRITRRDLIHNQFDLNFTNTGGTALGLTITSLNFSVNGYQIAGQTAPPSLQSLGIPQRMTVNYTAGPSSATLLVRVNYRYNDVNGNQITANTSYLRLK